jgi:hypothetical protein
MHGPTLVSLGTVARAQDNSLNISTTESIPLPCVVLIRFDGTGSIGP